MDSDTNDVAIKAAEQDDLETALRHVLADEFILLNNTSSCLSESSAMLKGDGIILLQEAYQQVKSNTELITELLRKKNNKAFVSINDIISNTRLKKLVTSDNTTAIIEIFLEDHLTIIKQLVVLQERFAKTLEPADNSILKQVIKIHSLLCKNLRKHLENIFSLKAERSITIGS